ncbi:MAG: diguanylate cyclase [Bacilli bacterium]
MVFTNLAITISGMMEIAENLILQFFISQALAHFLHAYYYRQKPTFMLKFITALSLIIAQVVIMLIPARFGGSVSFDLSAMVIMIAYGFFGVIYGHITFIATILFLVVRYIFFPQEYGSLLYFVQIIPIIFAIILIYIFHNKIDLDKGMRKASTVFYGVSLLHATSLVLYLLIFEEARANIVYVLITVFLIVPLLMLLNALIMFQQRRQAFVSQQLLACDSLQKASINAPKEMEIYVLDRDFNYMSYNDFHQFNMKRFFGTTPEVGRNFLSLIPNSHIRQRLEHSIARAFNGENYDVEFKQESMKGKYLHDFYAPLYDDKGHIIGATIFSYEITERKKREESITYLSYHDKLTGIYNRRYLEDHITDLQNYDDPVIVVYADINDLKVMNDLFGHEAGDELIITVAHKIKEAFRNFGIVARAGGDEIITVMKNAELVSVDSIIEDIKADLLTQSVEGIEVSVSLGRAVAKNGRGVSDAILKAEDAMYKDKAEDIAKHRQNIFNVILSKIEAFRQRNVNDADILETALYIGDKLTLSASDLEYLHNVVRLREIGHLVLPEEESNKAICSIDDDTNYVREKLQIAYRLLLGTEQYNVIANDVISHHENYDGSGYPRGLKGEEIPLKARIIKLAVDYATLISNNGNGDRLTKKEALAVIAKGSGTLYDPNLVDILLGFNKDNDK